ncbi:unnamed protein product [Polarella glacialis]|uniref:BTB domain-containing protein n=1 Tax=Polarella glacialis TaxID=89957 RepID=A0A813JG44_POLGL|nr:unnamed protein product [Polarella glacialis]
MESPQRESVQVREGKLEEEEEEEHLEGDETVVFDVGGKLHKVLYSPTFSLHSISLLKQLAGERQDKRPIFVEANQDLFQFILEYHRGRKIRIPSTVSVAAIIAEARKMGLDITSDDIIQEVPSLASLSKLLAAGIRREQDSFAKKEAEVEQQMVVHKAALVTNLTCKCILAQLQGQITEHTQWKRRSAYPNNQDVFWVSKDDLSQQLGAGAAKPTLEFLLDLPTEEPKALIEALEFWATQQGFQVTTLWIGGPSRKQPDRPVEFYHAEFSPLV